MTGNQNPEQKARDTIDALLTQAGWVVQSAKKIDLDAGLDQAVREYQTDVGPADYVLFVNKQAVGDEQIQIVAELESKLSETDQLNQTITTPLQQAEAVRQPILKKAFYGQLVAKDANDEPAATLLARIKAERAAHTQKSKKPLSKAKRNE